MIKMEVQEVYPVNTAAVPPPRFSVAVSNGNVMVVPLSQGQAAAAQLHQIPTHVLNEQVNMTDNFSPLLLNRVPQCASSTTFPFKR